MRGWVSSMALALLVGGSAMAVEPTALSDTLKILASDEFQGRAPGTPGEDKTVAYLIGRFKTLGLAPAGEAGGWTQKVPLRKIQVAPSSTFSIEGAGGSLSLQQGQQIGFIGQTGNASACELDVQVIGARNPFAK